MKTRSIRSNKCGRLKISAKQQLRALAACVAKAERESEKQAVKKLSRKHAAGRCDAVAEMVDFVRNGYELRFNAVMRTTEYRPRGVRDAAFAPIDLRVMRRMTVDAQLEGIGITANDMRNFLESDLIAEYNPLAEFLAKCEGQWDGNDRIRQLARTVPTGNSLWVEWFYRWFLGMVAQWRGCSLYANSCVPLLVSGQGFGKSTFCRRLLPPELRWGYNDNMLFHEKRQVLQAMSQFLLINMDEFNQMSPQLQQGFLKNLLQLPTVKVKRPYGKCVEEIPRVASFIATTNFRHSLTDPSGNRRFMAVELKAPIDNSLEIDYQQLYAQALHDIENGERTFLDEEETSLLMRSNREFQELSPMEMCFREMFDEGDEWSGAEYLSAAEIFMKLRRRYGSVFKANDIPNFGKWMNANTDLKKRRTSRGTEYLVSERL